MEPYIVYWFVYDVWGKRLTHKEFGSLEEAETFASDRLKDCVYKIRKTKIER